MLPRSSEVPTCVDPLFLIALTLTWIPAMFSIVSQVKHDYSKFLKSLWKNGFGLYGFELSKGHSEVETSHDPGI